jgi:hypothetical protein
LPGRISGVSKTSLWQAWKEVRSELRQATVRDVIDFLDYDVDPDIWMQRVLRQVNAGTYEPQTPLRFTLAKSGGFKRRLTIPAVPDVVLFRAVANFIHRKARKYQQPHVYYRRDDLRQAADAAAAAAQRDLQKLTALYRFTSYRSFRQWKNYEQYRRQLILKKLHRYIVITDITNFFDSVLHSEVSNAFRNYPVPSRLIGLLFFLLERLAIRTDYSDSPRIGLPVDQFECSRTIANLVLFPHDRRMTDLVGKHAYVRWMDDQVIGVNTRAEGLRIVAEVGASLSNLYLTANAKKTRVLSLREAKIHFHLETNAKLDTFEQVLKSKTKTKRTLTRELSRIWRLALRTENEGEWEKIQRRVYRLAGLTGGKFLRGRARKDLLKTPMLTDRIADYMRCSGPSRDYLRFTKAIINHQQQIHEDVELLLIESLLRIETKGRKARSISRMALDLLKQVTDSKKNPAFAVPACLLIVRFGDLHGRNYLKRCFREGKNARHPQLLRSAAICYSTYGRQEFSEVKKATALLLNNPLALMVRMVKRIQLLDQVPDRFKARLTVRWDPVSGRNYLDMRTFVAARLITLNRKKTVRDWLKQWVASTKRKKVSAFDRRLIQKVTK